MIYSVNSPLDKITAIKTAVASAIFIIAAVILFLDKQPWFGLFILALFLIIFLIVYFNIPKKIIVTDTEVVLCNHGFKRTIKRNDIIKARKFTANDKEGLWRKFAAEAIFGYCGIYSSNAHSTLYIYASQSKNWILIETGKKKYVVSPATPDLIDIIDPARNAAHCRPAATGK